MAKIECPRCHGAGYLVTKSLDEWARESSEADIREEERVEAEGLPDGTLGYRPISERSIESFIPASER